MTVPLWVSEAAEDFWQAAGGPEGFPRSLRIPIANALPVTVVLLPRLRVSRVDDWLRRRGIPGTDAAPDRPLRACLVACRGQGFIFVEGVDAEDEQRFSLAHELAHFLRSYWRPRAAALDRLGPEVLPVLDGERPPRPSERLAALLARQQLGYQVHLLDRDPDGLIADDAIDRAEREADELAFELLAPADSVLAGNLPAAPARRRAAVQRRLVDVFGLPPGPATRYATHLVPLQPRRMFLLRALRDEG